MKQLSEPPPLLSADTQAFLASQWRLNQALSRHLTPLIAGRHGVSLKDLMVLAHIQSGVQYPTELAEALQMPKHMASRVIDDLLGGGLIARSIDPDDARRTLLELSPAGQVLLIEAQKTVHDSLGQMFAQLPDAQRSQVLSAVATLAQAAQDAFGGQA